MRYIYIITLIACTIYLLLETFLDKIPVFVDVITLIILILSFILTCINGRKGVNKNGKKR